MPHQRRVETKLCSWEFEPVMASFTDFRRDACRYRLPQVDCKRGAHEYGIEVLAADQSGVLHAVILRIHRMEETRGAGTIAAGRHKIEAPRQKNDGHAGAKKPNQILAAVLIRT